MSKLEKNRFSILTNDLTKCFICGSPKQELHEIYFGKNRTNSMLFGCVVPLCFEHHRGNFGVHHDHKLDLYLKQLCQEKFEQIYPIPFESIFYKNYL